MTTIRWLLSMAVLMAMCVSALADDQVIAVINGQQASALNIAMDQLKKGAKSNIQSNAGYIVEHLQDYKITIEGQDKRLLILFEPTMRLGANPQAMEARFLYSMNPLELIKTSFGR